MCRDDRTEEPWTPRRCRSCPGHVGFGVTGCGAINEQATTIQYAASDGIVLNVGDLDVRNLMLVTKSATDEARLLGSLVNDTDTAQSLN